MTLPLLANNVTYGLWWQETNQMIGIINNLTDGQLVVNGAITFTNSQFSLSAPSQNITNTLALTSGSGNSLFLLSSNAVINGTVFLTGPNSGLAVSNNANVNQNLFVIGNTYTGNLTCYQTSLVNNMIANVITVTSHITGNLSSNTLFVSNNATFFNVSASNISTQKANVTQGLGVVGGLTSDFANLNFITSNNTSQFYAPVSINTAGSIHSTMFPGTGIAQYRAVQTSSGIIFRNDGNNFSILTTGNVANPYTASYNALIPFRLNVNDGSMLIDGTGAGVTFGGDVTISGAAEHVGNVISTGVITANGPGTGLYVANSSIFNGAIAANSTFTVSQSSFFNGTSFYTNGLNVTGTSVFASPVSLQSTFTVNGTSNFLGIVTLSNLTTVKQLLTANASQIGVISTFGEIQSSCSVSGSSLPFGQFRAIQGNYGVILRNDGSFMYLLQTPATISPGASTWNSFRPFFWNLATGAVTIDGGGSGTIIGGQTTITGGLGLSSTLSVAGAAGFSSTLNVAGGVGFGGIFTVTGGVNFNSTFTVSGVSNFNSNLNVFGVLSVTGTTSSTLNGFFFNSNVSTISSIGFSSVAYSINSPNAYMIGFGFYAYSDLRLKKNIEIISPEEGKDFVSVSKPVTFTREDSPSAGFIAQDQAKTKYAKYVGTIPHEGLEEIVDEDGLVSRENVALNLNYDNYVAYLTAFGKWSIDKIEQLEKKVAELEKRIGA